MKKNIITIVAIVVIAVIFTTVSLATDNSSLRLAEFHEIVVAPDASQGVRDAAKDLAYHLERILDNHIVITNKASGVKAFFVGPIAASQAGVNLAELLVGPEACVVRAVPKGIALFGDGSYATRKGFGDGTWHAVSLFLEKYCSVVWLWPGPSGEVISRNPDLVISAPDLSVVPRFRKRQMSLYYARFWAKQVKEDVLIWQRRTRQGSSIKGWFGHSWSHYIPAKDYFAEHPDWFAEVAGQRIPAQLCTSNPELRRKFVEQMLVAKENHKTDIWSISANDGNGFCRCDLCKEKGEIGDAYWDFAQFIANAIKEKAPSKGVGTFAYTRYRYPPRNIDKLPDNITLSMTSYAASHVDPTSKKEYADFVAGWKSKGIAIIIREYWGMHYWMDLPILYPNEIADEIKLGAEAGMIGMYGEAGKNFSTQAPNSYMLTHLMWNPEEDPSALLDSFYEKGFGNAARHIRAYYKVFEDAYSRGWVDNKLNAGYVVLVNSYHKIFTAAVMEEAEKHLIRAHEVAETDEIRARIEFIQTGFEYTSIMGRLLGLYHKLGRTGFPLEFFEWQATAVARRRHLKTVDVEGREYFEKFHAEPFTYTLQEKEDWLIEAWELGQKRIELYNANVDTAAIDEGLYAQTLKADIRQWHQTITRYLGKEQEDIVPLIYTGADKWGAR